MKQKFFLSILLSFFALSSFAQTTERRCSILSEQIVQLANQIKTNRSGDFPDAYITQVELDANLSNEGLVYNGAVEGYYRPENTVNFSVVPSSIASVQLNKDNHLLYLCGQIEDSGKYRLEIYFLGVKLRPQQVKQQLDEVFANDEIKITPLKLSLFNFGASGQSKKGMNFFKALFLPLYLQTKIFSGFASFFSNLFGVSVERIVLTNDDITVSGGIDINNPDCPKFTKTIKFDSPEGRLLLGNLNSN